MMKRIIILLILAAMTAQGAITRIQAVSANANNVAITSTTNGDLIIVFAYFAGTATIPSLAAGFTNIQSSAGVSQAMRIGYKISAGADTSSGTWTNATQVVCHVYRGTAASAAAIGATTAVGAGNSVTLSYAALTLQNTSGTSWVAAFGGASSATAGMNGTPTGTAPNLGNRTNQTLCNGLDTGAGATSFTAQTLTVTTSGRWQTYTIELKTPAVINGNFLMLLRK